MLLTHSVDSCVWRSQIHALARNLNRVAAEQVALAFIPMQHSLSIISNFKKIINNSRGKYKRNECLINVCKSDTDLS
jgi:hypothetical protein